MKKIEFDYLNGKFIVETDEENGDVFIREYTDLFLKQLEGREVAPMGSYPQNMVMPQNEVLNSGAENKANPVDDDCVKIFGIDAPKLAYLIDFSNDTINVIVRNKFIKGSKAEMQVNLALLYCGACEYKKQKANTKDIRTLCNKYQCLDGNFAPNLKKQNYFAMSGGTVNSDVALTMPGKDRLIEVVKELCDAMEAQ